MRKAKETDYWDRVYKRNYSNSLIDLKFNGYNSLQEVDFAKGITAICGLNGAGKSTIIAAIKDMLGLDLNESDLHKLNEARVSGTVEWHNQRMYCTNSSGERLGDKDYDLNNVKYFDCDENTKIQNFILKEKNFEDFLEQNEAYELTLSELEDVCYLTGKRYQVCEIWELEDIDDIGVIPFFKVTIDQVEYDSRNMGKGEHFLFYLFWCMNKCSSGTIVILEEPETYISIYSQMHFSNYLAKQIAEKGIQIIITTHSPYLLEHISNENIRIVSRMGNMATVVKPNDNIMAEDILGIKQQYMGTLFVEDKVACDYLSIILEDKAPFILKKYTIDIAKGGEEAISYRLSFPASEKIKYNFIGVYDGDMRNRLETSKLNWKWVFLPGSRALEELYREYLHEVKNVEKFCTILGKEKEQIITMLATIDGNDYHDWFEELRKYLGIDSKMLVRHFYNMMQEMMGEVECFISELKDLVS